MIALIKQKNPVLCLPEGSWKTECPHIPAIPLPGTVVWVSERWYPLDICLLGRRGGLNCFRFGFS